MSDTHKPDGRFVERLEWQLSSEFRRNSNFQPSSGKVAVPRRLIALSVMAGLLLTGVAVMKAADYVRDNWRKKIEIARAETEVAVKQAHLESISEMAFHVQKRVEAGMIREEEALAIQRAAEKASLDLQNSLLDLDEVAVTGEPPRRELYAPMASGRDFVSERLQNEKKAVELELEGMERHLGRFQMLVEKGMVRKEEMAHIQVEMDNLNAKITRILHQMDLRKKFVTGTITEREVEIMGRKAVAVKNLAKAESKVNTIKEQLGRFKALEERGLVSPWESRRLQFDLEAALAEKKLAALEVEVLEKISNK